MRRGRILLATAAALAVGLLAVAAAGAATPDQIYSDLAADGTLSHNYSAADLRAASLDAAAQGYGGVEEQTLRPVVAAVAAATKTYTCVGIDRSGNKIMAPANASNTGANAHGCVKGTQFTQTKSAGALPFTGLQLGVYAALGLALLGGGLLLRRAAGR
jgi:hypothetical protein